MKYELFPVADLACGEMRRVRLGDSLAVVVIRTQAGRLYALRDVCPHAGALLSRGALEAKITSNAVGEYEIGDQAIVRCPWHRFEFDAETGVCLADPRRRVRTYPVSVEGDTVVLERPQRGGARSERGD
jgi:nitrite reductase (NADH) small subunit